MHKKIIQIDLDGVLNNYNGNYKTNEIAQLKDGAFEFLEKLSKDFVLELFTVRDKTLCTNWLNENNLQQFFKKVTNIKNPFATLFIDDRAITFNGDYGKIYNQIIEFKPYWGGGKIENKKQIFFICSLNF